MISVVIPTYNRREMLLELIQSIKKQSYNNIELIIIDDCSTDGTEEDINSYLDQGNFIYIKNTENKGPGYNRNLGFNRSSGDYVVFADDDDYYTDFDFFQKVIDIFESRKNNLSVVSANCIIQNEIDKSEIRSNLGVYGLVNGIDFLLNIGSKYRKPQSTFTSVFKKSALVSADFENMKMVNDYAIYLRSLLFGDIFIIDDLIGVYRVHGTNISNNIKLDFMLENLNERVWVKNKLIEKENYEKINLWWNKQMIILIKYYLVFSNPSYKDALKICVFVLKRSDFSIVLYLKVFSLLLFYKILSVAKPILTKLKNVLRKSLA